MFSILVMACCMQVPTTYEGVTVDDYFSLSYLSSCAISPDGKWTAWTEGRWDAELDRRNTDIWISTTEQGEPIRLTFDEANDSSLHWGIDSEWLYFSSRRGSKGDDLPRNGKLQVWRIRPGGTGLMAVTRLPGGVSDWKLSFDGASLYYKLEDETQLDDGWKALRSSHDKVEYAHGEVDYSELWKLDLRTWRHELLWDEDAVIQYFAPSPSGKSIAIITTPDQRLITNEGWSVIGVFDVASKETTVLDDTLWRAEAPSPYGWVEAPEWSTDERRLLFTVDYDGYQREMFVATFEVENSGIQKVVRHNEVTIGSDPQWMPNSHTILYIAEEGTRRPLLRVDTVGFGLQGDTTQIVSNSLVCWDFSISSNALQVVALISSSVMTTSVVKVTDNPNRVVVITNPNKHVSDWNIPSVKTVSWLAPDGTTVEGVLELPKGYSKTDGPLPMYVDLHGGPTSARQAALQFSMYGRGLLSTQGWAVLSPNYRGSTGYGDKFLTDLIGRENDIEVQDILAGVDAMIDRGIADKDKLAVGGWSNGGYLTNCIIATTNIFKAASSGAGVFDQTMQWAIEDTPGHVVNYAQGLPWTAADKLQDMSPIYEADNITTPTIIHVGAGDARVPAEQSLALYRSLHDYLDVPTQLITYPGTGHGLSKMTHRRAKIEWDKAWFEYWVLGTTTEEESDSH
jgi:dipeptidyl aminopeptidase/acylaminoacyl peptidase